MERPSMDNSPEKPPVILFNSLTGQPVIISEARSRRPGGGGAEWKGECPFCPGHESMTPPEIWAVGREGGPENGPGWKLRLIPNLYPALVEEAGPGCGPWARGRHEVLVLTPDHDRTLARMEHQEVVEVLQAIRLRYSQLCAVEGVRQVVVMVNQGREAGASLEHPHAQLFALPLVSPLTLERGERFSAGEGCPLCIEMDSASAEGRMVIERGKWAAFSPRAPRFSYETWTAGKVHRPHIAACDEGELESMGEVLHLLLRSLARCLSDPPYNLVLHCAPCGGEGDFHFYWELLPRLGRLAGFELGTGMFINPVPADAAARTLREALP